VIIDYFHIIGVNFAPLKTDTVLFIDANTPLTDPIATGLLIFEVFYHKVFIWRVVPGVKHLI